MRKQSIALMIILMTFLIILSVGIAGCSSQAPSASSVTQPATPPTTTAAPTVAPTAMGTTVGPTPVATNVTPAPVNTTAKPTATSTPQIVVTIKLTNYNTVDPSGTVVIQKGTKVVWENQMMARDNMIRVEGLFTSPAINAGGSFSYTFDKVGTYDWMSTTNGAFKGTITVQ
jgi:plastocyanin